MLYQNYVFVFFGAIVLALTLGVNFLPSSPREKTAMQPSSLSFKSTGLPEVLHANTNPPVQPSLRRELASEEGKELNHHSKAVEKENESREKDKDYSKLDPNLYEGSDGSGVGSNNLLQIEVIQDQIDQ